MDDFEVRRLRRLRDSALRVRAIARSLGSVETVLNDPLLRAGGQAAWRIVRTVTGKLRAHPRLEFQKDAGVGTLLGNSVVAYASVLCASSRQSTLKRFDGELNALAHELRNVRALTWASDLSDSLGRSQDEIRSLIATLGRELQPLAAMPAPPSMTPQPPREAPQTSGSDWPYLAI